ncbi:asparagine synthase [Streptomyces sp. TP-A0874]|uniref:asparagine synthase n=1 Tax=Streptomyces sp. TP-A0874 TaxID=549819 RepID=UPI000A868A74|nr:asparagine synthase [Streptomyces sp. TP-A0874]
MPDDELELPEASAAFRETLVEAVGVRTRGERHVACELSGGADSTTLSAIDYRQVGSRLVNLTRVPADPGNDDAGWARSAVAAQAGARHLLVELGQFPSQFAGLEKGASAFLDAPSPAAASPDRQTAWWRHTAGTGARVLLSGKGADELLMSPLSYLAHARRRDPQIARKHLAGWAALWGVSRKDIRHQAAHPGPYRQWLTALCSQGLPAVGWESGPHVPPWLTAPVRDALAEELAAAAAAAGSPLHERAHQHTTMVSLRAIARCNRIQADLAAWSGLKLGYPYTDFQVIEAALRCRAEQRISPYRLKPLLSEAMRGIVPDGNLNRRTKGGYNADTDRALERHRPVLAQLLGEESVTGRSPRDSRRGSTVGPADRCAHGSDAAPDRHVRNLRPHHPPPPCPNPLN